MLTEFHATVSFRSALFPIIFLLCLPGRVNAQSDSTSTAKSDSITAGIDSTSVPITDSTFALPVDSIISVTGVALDKETGTPLAGAHAFIGATMIGTATDAEGRFELTRLPTGSHTLWISMLGYEPESQEFIAGDTTKFEFEIALKPMVFEMGEVTVLARKNRRWKKRMKTFQKLFLGESDMANSVKILNEEVLDFEANWLGKFSAKASESLVIENLALGYRVQYVLKEFTKEGITIKYDGDPFFEELEASSPEEAQIWEDARKEAYLGSFKHFLLSLLDGTTYEEGFRLMQIPSVEDIRDPNRRFRIDPEDLLAPGEKAGEQLLAFRGVIEITYINELEGQDYLRWQGASPHRRRQNQRSWIRLTTGPTLIDPVGEIVDPYGVTVYGYYAFERVGNDLPKEYRLD